MKIEVEYSYPCMLKYGRKTLLRYVACKVGLFYLCFDITLKQFNSLTTIVGHSM